MKPNSVGDKGFRRKLKLSIVERHIGKQNEEINYGQIPKPLQIMCFGMETCAHFRKVNNMNIKRDCKQTRKDLVTNNVYCFK